MNPRSVVVRSIAALAAIVLFVAVTATAASAHAVLLQTTPTSGQILSQAPKTISLRYNEPVEANLGSVRLYDTSGQRIDTSGPSKPSAEEVTVAVRKKLGPGAYVVTWRVISADSHPVQGSFTFQVGTAANATSSSVQALADNLLQRDKGSQAVGIVYGIARWLVFVGLALLVGVVGFVLLVWSGALASRRTRRLVWSGWWILTLATVASFLLEGPYGAGLGFSALWKPNVIDDVLGTHFGHVLVARVVLLAIAAFLIRMLVERRTAPPSHALSAALAALGAGVLLTVSLAGHADVGDFVPLALIADWVHLLAMSLWLGGLVVLAVVVLAKSDLDVARRVVPRFSQLALLCVWALILSGSYQTWRQVGGWQALRQTDFGQLLTIKLFIFFVVLVVAARSRAITNYLFRYEALLTDPSVPVMVGASVTNRGPSSDPSIDTTGEPGDQGPEDDDDFEEIDPDFERRTLRRAVAFEALLLTGVLVVTALLVNAQPGRSALATQAFSGGSVGITLKSNRIWVDITIAPGTVGTNDVHVNTLIASGGLTTPLDFTLTLDLPSKGIAPLTIPLTKAGPGHYLASGFTIPLAGEWRVTARVLLSETDEATVVGKVTIR
ncbi:MAG TPA: copper resistance protein CopC [Acidimicrobiia bacterium]